MNLLGKGTIAAALFAATASVVMAAPAQALTLANNSGFAFDGDLKSAFKSGSTYTFDFLDISPNGRASLCYGSFTCPDQNLVPGDSDLVTFSDLSVTAPGGAVAPFLFISGLATTVGDVDFFIDGVSNFVDNGSTVAFSLKGYFAALSDPHTVLGKGSFSGEYNAVAKTFSGNLATEVPTPAAVLPVLGGLLGMASKRKREEEENS